MLNTTLSFLILTTLIVRIIKLVNKKSEQKQILKPIKEKYDPHNETNKFNKLKTTLVKIKPQQKINQNSTQFIIEIITKLESGTFFQKAWTQTLHDFTENKKYSKQVENTIKTLHTICAYTNSLGTNTTQILGNINKTIQTNQKLEIEKEISITPAKTTIKILSTLPLFAIMLGFILGVNTIQILTQTQSGNICLILGLLLYSTGQIWVKNINEKATKNMTLT